MRRTGRTAALAGAKLEAPAALTIGSEQPPHGAYSSIPWSMRTTLQFETAEGTRERPRNPCQTRLPRLDRMATHETLNGPR